MKQRSKKNKKGEQKVSKKTQICITMDTETYYEAIEKIPNRKISETINKLLKEYLNTEKQDEKKGNLAEVEKEIDKLSVEKARLESLKKSLEEKKEKERKRFVPIDEFQKRKWGGK